MDPNRTGRGGTAPRIEAYWALESQTVLKHVESAATGLSSADAARRLAAFGPNSLSSARDVPAWTEFLRQFRSPIIWLLMFAAVLAGTLGDPSDAGIIGAILLASAFLSFRQEHQAGQAVKRLLSLVAAKVDVMRDGAAVRLPVASMVSGDVQVLRAGSLVAGDGVLLEAQSLLVNEATLTGETFPVEKTVGVTDADAPLNARTNALFKGTHVQSGTGRLLIVGTGADTELGRLAETLKRREPEPEFQRGVRQYGFLLMEFTLALTLFVFAANVYFQKPLLDSFLFALALAVGLTPQLLPAILSLALARGAQTMAKAKVIVKRLESIEDFGEMDVLCSDKTGTLTEGIVQVVGAFGVDGHANPRTKRAAELTALLQTGLANPIDEALLAGLDRTAALQGVRFLGDVPYDFQRRRLSVACEVAGGAMLASKGALESMLEICASARIGDGTTPLAGARPDIERRFAEWSAQGLRVLGVASRDFGAAPSGIGPELESGLTFEGFLVLGDPLRADSRDTVEHLRKLGVRLKLLTGDNRLVAAHAGEAVGLRTDAVATGKDLESLSARALLHTVGRVDIFAEVDPSAKERILLALKRAGHVVGYIGDGINDGPALHAADVGISVASASDVAREEADFVMLEPALAILPDAVVEGRRIFSNTLKYIYITTSANFGNMFSMAGASLFLPFLPLLPKQILLNNFFSDFPAMTIATDAVDPEQLERPRRWDVRAIRRFMIVFGLISSVFDFLTFAALYAWLRVTPEQFRTGWFIESLVSELLVLLVIRTTRPFWRSPPSKPLLWASLGVMALAFLMPALPGIGYLGFVSLPWPVIGALTLILAAYVAANEVAKRWFFYARPRH